jgi:CHAT domain-containing protein
VPYLELISALILWAKADTFLADGKAAQAENALKAAVKHAIADTAIAADRARSVERAPAVDVTWQLLDLMEAQLARLLASQGRPAEAESTARAMLARDLDRFGRGAPSTAIALATLGEVLAGQGRWTEAARLATLATRILESSGTESASAYFFAARKVGVDAMVGLGRWHNAVALIEEVRASLAGHGTMVFAAERQGAWALAMLRTRQAATAEDWLSRLYAEQRRVFGEERYETCETLGLLAMALAAKADAAGALQAFVKAVPVLTAPANVARADTENAMRRIKRRAVLLGYIEFLHGIQGGPVATAAGIDAPAEALRIGESLRGGAVQGALAASAARALARTARLGELIRREQDSKRELGLLDERLLTLALAPESRERDAALAASRSRARTLEEERRSLLRDIESQFPSYADLVSPQPATAIQVRRILRRGEAALSIVSGEDRTFVWALSADKVAFHASLLGAPEIEQAVAKLRASLEIEGDDPNVGPFDLSAARLLYTELLAPLGAVLESATDLSVVTDGALARLPLSILPTEAPRLAAEEAVPFESLKDVAWLARRQSVTNVPSLGALVRLRALPAASGERKPLIGFGDPRFSRDIAPEPDESMTTRRVSLRKIVRRDVDYANYARLAPLPDTRLELRSIAAALGADPERDLFVGPAASRANVIAADMSRRRVVAFATHGLVAGELPGLTQPALALSLPLNATDSPLLTLEDVLGLRLDADLVVLSACNTAAADGRGAEALSGLGRGFFYAGSRAVLATHWPVETEAARVLVSELFARYAGDPEISRAQALRMAMLALIDGPGKRDSSGKTLYAYAHPLFWAPYALYGDGAR